MMNGFLNLAYTSKEEIPDMGYISMRSNGFGSALDHKETDGVYQMERQWVIHPIGQKGRTTLSWKEGDLQLNDNGHFWIKI